MTSHFVHCALTRIPYNSCHIWRMGKKMAPWRDLTSIAFYLLSPPEFCIYFTPLSFPPVFPSYTGIHCPLNLPHFSFPCDAGTNIMFLSVYIIQCWNYINSCTTAYFLKIDITVIQSFFFFLSRFNVSRVVYLFSNIEKYCNLLCWT
jgi:hypothetical protein